MEASAPSPWLLAQTAVVVLAGGVVFDGVTIVIVVVVVVVVRAGADIAVVFFKLEYLEFVLFSVFVDFTHPKNASTR